MVINLKKLTSSNNAKISSNHVLTDKNSVKPTSIYPLTSDVRSSRLFKIAITETLLQPYTFGKLKVEGIKGFGNFLSKTVGKNLTISNVESLFLRTSGPNGAKNEEKIHGHDETTYHFSNGSRNFRLHGYYNDDGYFCICRIDPNHKFKYKKA